MIDALVVGGGPAGLQAALTLARIHLDVLLVDSRQYRNGTVEHAHNLAGHDGRAPADIRRMARDDLAAYPTVTLREARVETIERDGDTFVAVVDGERVEARGVVLATGLHDELPDVPGLREAWGREVAHCPFCHGHELAGRRIGILGAGPHVAMQAAMLGRIGDVTTYEDLESVERVDGGLRLHLPDGSTDELGGLFVAPVSTQAAPFAEQLGLTLLESGCVEVDLFGQTSVPGVVAAGDMAHVKELPMPMASLATAAAAGQLAGSMMVRHLVGQEMSAAG